MFCGQLKVGWLVGWLGVVEECYYGRGLFAACFVCSVPLYVFFFNVLIKECFVCRMGAKCVQVAQTERSAAHAGICERLVRPAAGCYLMEQHHVSTWNNSTACAAIQAARRRSRKERTRRR